MSTLTHRDFRGPFMDVFEWLESPWTVLRPAASHPMRVEDYVEDGTYVLRAELPGVDPDKDIEVTVFKGILTISAHRQEENGASTGRSSGTVHSPAVSRCPNAPMRTTSGPATTAAFWRWSSPSRIRQLRRRPSAFQWL